LCLLEIEPARRLFALEGLEHAELDRCHDGPRDPETQEDLEHVVRIW
jgi:hypothetical protein